MSKILRRQALLVQASLSGLLNITGSQKTHKAIALALLVQDGVGFVASLLAQLSNSVNALGWSNPVLYGLMTLGYAYFLFVRPEKS